MLALKWLTQSGRLSHTLVVSELLGGKGNQESEEILRIVWNNLENCNL